MKNLNLSLVFNRKDYQALRVGHLTLAACNGTSDDNIKVMRTLISELIEGIGHDRDIDDGVRVAIGDTLKELSYTPRIIGLAEHTASAAGLRRSQMGRWNKEGRLISNNSDTISSLGNIADNAADIWKQAVTDNLSRCQSPFLALHEAVSLAQGLDKKGGWFLRLETYGRDIVSKILDAHVDELKAQMRPEYVKTLDDALRLTNRLEKWPSFIGQAPEGQDGTPALTGA